GLTPGGKDAEERRTSNKRSGILSMRRDGWGHHEAHEGHEEAQPQPKESSRGDAEIQRSFLSLSGSTNRRSGTLSRQPPRVLECAARRGASDPSIRDKCRSSSTLARAAHRQGRRTHARRQRRREERRTIQQNVWHSVTAPVEQSLIRVLRGSPDLVRARLRPPSGPVPNALPPRIPRSSCC